MSTPKDINRAHISFDAASKVLDSIDSGDAVEAGGSDGSVSGGDSPRRPYIDGYVLDRELGSGASGITYLAHKSGAEARVALKVLHASLGNKTKSSRAWRELEILQQIRVSSVPRLLDYGTTGGSLYIATEFLEGSPLDRLYEHAQPANPAEMRERVQLLERLARAAHTLHEHGVIHRDLKPSNVIVMPTGPDGKGGTPFIIDLGIALIDAPDLHQTLTQEGTPIGTPAFMAPEQARGESAAISTRSDIYSLGAIGYWLCTGQTPHDLAGVTLHEAIRRVGSELPREAREISRLVPKGLGAVLGKACAPKPADRYGSATAFADDLGRWIGREPVLATRPGAWRRCVRWVGEHPIATTVAACAVIALTIVGSAGFVTWRLTMRPDHLAFSDNRKSVRLVTATNTTLRTWEADERGGVKFAQIIDCPRKLGGGRVLVIWAKGMESDPYNNTLAIYDLGNYAGKPIWTNAGPIKTPGDLGPKNAKYTTVEVLMEDIFLDSPGPEIVVTISCYDDPNVTRIYDLAGTILYEVWHWGDARPYYWLKDPRYLIYYGCDNSSTWEELGYPEVTERRPRVLFAVKPVKGAILGWMNGPGESAEAQPAWRQYILPPATIDLVIGVRFTPPEHDYSPDNHFAVWFDFVDDRGSLLWEFNADGVPVEAPIVSDAYRQRPDNPLPESIFFGTIPHPRADDDS